MRELSRFIGLQDSCHTALITTETNLTLVTAELFLSLVCGAGGSETDP
jgi:hypothetical protein